MDKLKLAHDWYMKHSESASFMYTEVDQAWQYADAMQAEAEERNKAEAAHKRKEVREILNDANTFIEREGQHFEDVEWQPDWSQAPEWADFWAMDKSLEARWILSDGGDPYIGMCNKKWFSMGRFNSNLAPSFNYQGDWKNSLRKRPK